MSASTSVVLPALRVASSPGSCRLVSEALQLFLEVHLDRAPGALAARVHLFVFALVQFLDCLSYGLRGLAQPFIE